MNGARLPPARAFGRLRGAARFAAEGVVFYGVIALFSAGCLIWSPLAAALHRTVPRRIGTRLGQAVIRAAFRAVLGALQAAGLFRCDLAALDTLRDEAALVIAPNHPMLLDAVMVISRLPRVVCIMKAPIWDNVLLGAGARLAGYIRNDAPHVLVRRAAQAVADGNQLLVFPEGTRTVRPPVNAFKGGLAVMARKAGAPIQTVFIESDAPYLRKGWPLLRRPAFPVVYRATLGRRFEPGGDTAAFITDLEAYFRQELAPFA